MNDPQRTLDVAAGRVLRYRSLPERIGLDDLDERAECWTMINAAWCLLAFGCGVVILFVVGIPLQSAFGDSVTKVVGSAALGSTFFCLAGCANALWRRYWWLARARRLQRVGGPRRAYDVAWRRATPSNRTVVFQLAVDHHDRHRGDVGHVGVPASCVSGP